MARLSIFILVLSCVTLILRAEEYLLITGLDVDHAGGIVLKVEADKEYSYTVTTSETVAGLAEKDEATITNVCDGITLTPSAIAKTLHLQALGGGNLHFFKVFGEEIITYSGEILEDIIVGTNQTVKLKDVNLSDRRVKCLDSATIILEGSNTISATNYVAAIRAGGSGSTLTIKGSGSLTATGGNYAAGIGGDYQTACGNIVIDSGSITAQGGVQAPGIGGGLSAACGDITINGGVIDARMGSLGSKDIGPARLGTCGKVTISASATVNGSHP